MAGIKGAFDYVRKAYNMPWLKRGSRVRIRFNGRAGRVLSAANHVRVLLDGDKHRGFYHPHDLADVAACLQCKAFRGKTHDDGKRLVCGVGHYADTGELEDSYKRAAGFNAT